jgi:hypothetical protein
VGEEEVTFTNINGPDWGKKRGARKIEYGTSQSQKNHVDYIWIDTCCIDKSSSAELSEAINSMYRWYEESEVCYAYLEDVEKDYEDAREDPDEDTSNDSIKILNENVEYAIRKSRWFTRGWTLQELVAPSQIIFFAKNWSVLGVLGEKDNNYWQPKRNHWQPKRNLIKLLSSITTIPEAVLADPSLRTSCSVAKKMSWAAHRETTREEDMAYSLLGIFEVNMPLLYGEGYRAFIRLQEEIIKGTNDQSLFAWGIQRPLHLNDERHIDIEILAPSPAAFALSSKIVPFPSTPDREPYTMTNKGLRIDLRLLEKGRIYGTFALLDCHYEDDFSGVIGIPLEETSNTSVYTRLSMRPPRKWSTEVTENVKVRTIYVSKRVSRERRKDKAQDIKCLIRRGSLRNPDSQILKVLPSSFRSNLETGVIFVALEYNDERGAHGATLIVEFYCRKFNNYFAVVLSVLYDSDPYLDEEGNLLKALKIISQPEGGASHKLIKDKWKKQWRTERAWKDEDTQLVNVSKHPQGAGIMKITARASYEMILNQSVLVLDVECNWTISPTKDETAGSS